jgi:hypothetical protein
MPESDETDVAATGDTSPFPVRGLRVFAAVGLAVVLIVAAIVWLPDLVAGDDEWDPRLAQVARDVEQLRGLEFDHPVAVEQLGDDEFESEVTGGATSAADRRAWKRAGDELMALGFIDHPIPLKALRDDAGDFYGGYYDPQREAIVVRDEKLTTPAMRALLAHELTHALQDQRFSLDTVQRRSRRSDVPRSLVEGDAERVAQLYVESRLTDRERERMYASQDDGDGAIREGAVSMPAIFELDRLAPYRLGSRMIWVLEAHGEQRAIDDAFRDPPIDDDALLDPRVLLDPHHIAKVAPPEVAPTELRRGRPHGMEADYLYFILAARLAPSAALHAAEHWGGGRSVLLDDQETPCLRATVVGRDGVAGAAVIADALRQWAASGHQTVPIQVDGDRVTFTACVPADPPPAVSDAAMVQAFEHLTLRYDLTEAWMRRGSSVAQATCAADDTLAQPSVTGPLGTVTTIHAAYPPALIDAVNASLDRGLVPAACQ